MCYLLSIFFLPSSRCLTHSSRSSRIARLHTARVTQLRSCLKKHRTSSRRFCGNQTALISIRSITEFGAYCRSMCTVLAFATSATWRSGWSRNGARSALVRKSSIRLSGSGAHVCGHVCVKEEDTSNINCSLDTLGIDSICLCIDSGLDSLMPSLAVLEIFLFHCVYWIIYKSDIIRCICLKLCTNFRVSWLI